MTTHVLIPGTIIGKIEVEKLMRRPFSSLVWMPLFLLDPRVAGPQDHRSCRTPKALLGPPG